MSTQIRRIRGLDGCIPVTPRAAHFLLAQFDDHSARMRAQARDPEIYAVLVALRDGALEWSGSAVAELQVPTRDSTPEPAAESGMTTDMVSTTQAADLLGLTDRAIRKAIQEGRLATEGKQNGRHQISRTEIAHYRARTR